MKQVLYDYNNFDGSTGEIQTRQWATRIVKNSEMFIRTYVEDIGALAKCSGAEQSTILCCLKYIDYNTNRLYLDTNRRDAICECANISRNTLNSAISRLVKKNFLIRESSCAYVLNPTIFFFGTDLEREKVFKLTIEYRIEN